MSLFVRFTENIESDIERGTSILTTHDNMIVDGLCAFGSFNTIEECEKCAKFWFKFYPEEHVNYSIITGNESFGKKGSLGTVVVNPILISKHINK